MAVINWDPGLQGFVIHIHMHSFVTKNAKTYDNGISWRSLSIDRKTLTVLECVFKRRAGLLYQTIYTSGFIVSTDSATFESCIAYISKKQPARCLSTGSQPLSVA
jgi:hypothetical protein